MLSNGTAARPLAAQPQAAAPSADHAVEIQLASPISGHRDVIRSLYVRHITMGDWVDIGAVVRRFEFAGVGDVGEQKSETVEDPQRLMRWMARLTGQPEAILRQLKGRDASAVAAEIKMMVIEFALGKSRSELLSSSASSE